MVKHPRLTALRALARKHSCTHILVSDVIDCEYLSGFHATNVQLLVSARNALLLTDFRYQKAAEKFCRTAQPWRLVTIKERGLGLMKELLGDQAIVGIQSDILTVDGYDRLRRACRGVKFIKIAGEISTIASVKLPHELKSLRRAASIGDRAYADLLKELREGVTERETALRLEDLCVAYGSQGPSFDTIVLFGPRSALPHGVPGKRKLRRGDWVLCDFGCRFDGLCSDMTRTAVFGQASEQQRRQYEIVRRAQANARKSVKPGVKASTVDFAARSIIEKAGHGEAFGHATGHGVGRRVHEEPRLSKNDESILRTNMVVTVEPGIYLADQGGVRIEDMMLLTERGARSLTSSPRNLVELQP
ncbi:MAG: M24 family metallopeptidase [Chitinivibrionales bacterium]|nr:M24 family metallopeptidase [Chitinivibrionales bacterium]MBD3358195.1 M24 family metallopeptidase [Chitinivibrionales bacterium]